MKKIVDNIHISAYNSKLFQMYFGGKSFVVFDIETTGLSPANSKVVLTGLFSVSPDGTGQVVQYFADQEYDEEEVIRATMEDLQKVDFVVTYNGRHFDMPFMEKRAAKYGIDFPNIYNLDLYLLISGYAPFKEALPGLKQKNIEFYMGLSDGREDLISGKESVELYHRYMEMKSFDLEEKILLHNHDDIIQLYQILPIMEKLDFHKAMFKRGFISGNYVIEEIRLKGRDLTIKARQLGSGKDYIAFPTEDAPYMLMMNSSSKTAELTIPCECESGSLYVDAQAILGHGFGKLPHYPSVTNGYLILSQNKQINEMEINAMIKTFFEEEPYAI